MSSTAVTAGGYEVHTGPTIHRAYDAVFQNLPLVIQFAWLPYLFVLAAEVLGVLIVGEGSDGQMLAWMLGGLGFIVFGTIFAVRWIRHLLLGEMPTAELFPPAWRPMFFATVTIALLIFAGGITIALLSMILLPLAVLIWGAGAIAVALIAVRILPMLPSAAVEQPIDVRTAWEMMHGNYWHLVACALICYVPFALIDGVISGSDDSLPWLVWLIMEAIRLAVSFLGLACLYAMLADVYQGMTGFGRRTIAGAAD